MGCDTFRKPDSETSVRKSMPEVLVEGLAVPVWRDEYTLSGHLVEVESLLRRDGESLDYQSRVFWF